MNRKIINASKSDREEILNLYRSMLHGPAGWNESYPSEETIDFDLSRNALYVMKDEQGEIIATITIDQDEEVEKLKCWSVYPSKELSRLCVREDKWNQGIARQMMQHAFGVLQAEGMKGVHILVKKGHDAAFKSYGKFGYNIVGECRLFEKEYVCMELRF